MAILNAEKRNKSLKGKQLRKQGFIPAVIYGKDLEESLMIQFPQNEVKKFLRMNTTGSRVELDLGDKKYNTLLKDITYVPVKNEPEHLSFQTLISGEKITSTAQIILINKERIPDTIMQPLHELSYRAFPADLFDKIEVDMEGRETGDILRVSDLEVAQNEAIEIRTSPESIVFSIIAHSTEIDDDELSEEGETEDPNVEEAE